MIEIDFLSLDDILEIHKDQIQQYGGLLGVRDQNLLESAIAMPKVGIGNVYFHDNLYKMAAAYLFHIVKDHPFIDGNKRTGAVAAILFLEMNGIDIDADEEDLENFVIQVAKGKIHKDLIASFFMNHS